MLGILSSSSGTHQRQEHDNDTAVQDSIWIMMSLSPNTSLELTRLTLSVVRCGFPPFGCRGSRGSVLGR